MPKLKNTLVDACVVVGMNQDTELVHLSGGPQMNDSRHEKYGPYKQHVLSVFTETVAYFPEAVYQIEGEPFYEECQVICPKALTPDEGATPSTPAYRRSVSYIPDAKRVLPFSTEVIQSLPTFCFPSGGYVFKEPQEPHASYLVLTNMEGARTYSVCITCTRPLMTIESVDNKGKFKLSNANISDSAFCSEGKMTIVYVPICICLVSSYPYINTMKNCLSSFLPEINVDSSNFWRPFMKMSTVVTSIPVPPAGPLAIKFSLFGCSHTVYPADEADRRVVDVDLHHPLLIFSAETIVKIITCLLTQQRMVFMCSSFPLLSLVIETFLTYIDPIKWRLTYVPVLPNSLGDLMEAPGPFIMGVHSSLRSQVKQVRKQPETPGIVLVNIDKGEVDCDEKCIVPSMPDIVSQSLLVRLRRAAPHYDLKLVGVPTLFSYEDCLQQRLNLIEDLKAEIKDAFLDMLVSLFGDIFNHMSFGERFFDKDAYLQSRHDDERSFFIEVINSDAFERFVEERMENHERRDAFTMLGERIAAQRKSPSRSRSSSIIQHIKHTTNISPIFNRKTSFFTMPVFLEESISSDSYLQIYMNSLTNCLEQIDNKSISLKASYLYLRGFAQIACDQPIEGLRDFHSLYSSAPELFPKDFAAEVVSKLPPNDLDQLQRESFYKQTAMFRTFTNKQSDRTRNGTRKLPSGPVNRTEFSKRVKTMKIAVSSDLIDWLFNTLTEDGENVYLDKFTMLYKIFSDIDKHSENREVSGVKIKTKDRILHVSSLISSMNGMGRIVLTTNKLYFVPDGARECTLITPLCDIKEIIKYQHSSVFWVGVQALRIINSDRNIPPFYACLKEERDVWLLFLNEMAAGHKSAIAMRDPKIVDLAVNNVLVARAMLEMNIAPKIVEGACFFLKRNAAESEGLSEETKEALEMRLDPCVREAKRTTVMSIAYVPGNAVLNESASLWCGMGSGAIMVYETDKWNCVSELRYAKNRISCLYLVGTNQIWAGSYDSVIYVINTETRKSEQQLQNHTDFVSDIITQVKTDPISLKKAVVWSSSYNGQIICWDPETREAVNSLMLKKVRTLSQIILVNETSLWCVTSDKIFIVDTTSKECPVLQKLIVYDEYQMPVLLEYALKVSPTEIWVGSKSKGGLYIWDTKKLSHEQAQLEGSIQICSMVAAYGNIWIGNKDGKVILLTPDTKKIERELHAHTDVVKSMCETREGHVITGSSSKEGKVCVWNSMMGFEMIDGKRRRVVKKAYDSIREDYEFVDKNVALPAPIQHF